MSKLKFENTNCLKSWEIRSTETWSIDRVLHNKHFHEKINKKSAWESSSGPLFDFENALKKVLWKWGILKEHYQNPPNVKLHFCVWTHSLFMKLIKSKSSEEQVTSPFLGCETFSEFSYRGDASRGHY